MYNGSNINLSEQRGVGQGWKLRRKHIITIVICCFNDRLLRGVHCMACLHFFLAWLLQYVGLSDLHLKIKKRPTGANKTQDNKPTCLPMREILNSSRPNDQRPFWNYYCLCISWKSTIYLVLYSQVIFVIFNIYICEK